mgnify:CR=1 FL=1
MERTLHLRLTCGLLASAARLTPVPFLDDFLGDRARRLMVDKTLSAHGRRFPSKQVAPLYADPHGCLYGCLLSAVKLLLFPVKKVLTWLFALRYLTRDLSDAVLLGRALDGWLEAGRLADATDPPARLQEASLLRSAFDNAVAGTDMQLLQGLLMKALRGVSGLPKAAWHAVRRLRRGGAGADPTEGLSEADDDAMKRATAKLGAALETPEARAFLEAFDARLAENVRILEARHASG